MSTNSQFLSHLRDSGARVKDWPSWKTDMWQNDSNSSAKAAPTLTFYLPKNSSLLLRTTKK
jgi:hypothetical protein